MSEAQIMIRSMIVDINNRASYAALTQHPFYNLGYNPQQPIPVAPQQNVWADFQARRAQKRQILQQYWGVAPTP